MGISFFRWLSGKYAGKPQEVICQQFYEAAQEVHIRELAFQTCVNLIANAVGKCEFKTFSNGKEVRQDEYYLWNIEPNVNQNSSAFLHDLINQLYRTNEALIISTKHRDGHEMLVVASSFQQGPRYPGKMNEYKDVCVGDFTYPKTFRENEVMHLVLNSQDIKPVLDALYGSYFSLIAAAQKCFRWKSGTHLKVKVGQIAEGRDDFVQNFNKMMNDQVGPWLNSDSAVLPEFEGYQYSNDLADKSTGQQTTRDIRALIDDIFDFTAKGCGIPPVLAKGNVAGTQDVMLSWLTTRIDPLCEQIQEEANRKRYGKEAWMKGNYLHIDTTTIMHFDMFANAANVEKLIGSGAYSINDVLVAAGQPEIDEDWARLHWLTLNIGTMEAAARAAENSEKGGDER